MKRWILKWRFALLATLTIVPIEASAQGVFPLIKPEQRQIYFRDPVSFPGAYATDTSPPPTVDNPNTNLPKRPLSLDEAIRIALEHAEVVRVLAGDLAVSSGSTIYDPAIANTAIDDERARFDPFVDVQNGWNQTESPSAFFNPFDPFRSGFAGTKAQDHQVNVDLSQTNLGGGTARYRFGNTWTQFQPGVFPLNPQNRFSNDISYTQPLMRGAGVDANSVPIVLARIDTERSYFQFTDSVQELVRGVIAAYWSLVFARTDEWARRIQVEQSEEAYKRAEARQRFEFADIREVAQARSALARFRANLISARANVLQREAALQNILGLPPTEPYKIVPTTPPAMDKIDFDWNEVNSIARTRRPDLVELKLILEADGQRLLLARNNARPNLDAVALYRWNGLEGRLPNRDRISTGAGEFTDWTLGVNFSVPLLLRRERANVRSSELLIARDRANLQQGYHSVRHQLALNIRNMDQYYAQYGAFQEAREAAKENLERQVVALRVGHEVIFLNVLEAITEWGNSVSQEASSLAQYNTELANLERETGTILETHGVYMYEDRFCALGPMWCLKNHGREYPRDIHAGPNADRYPQGDEPSEDVFNLDDYPRREPARKPDDPLPRPRLIPPDVPAPPQPTSARKSVLGFFRLDRLFR